MDVKTIARHGAQKICGQSTCHYDLGCGHTNNHPQWPKYQANAICPLAKYNIAPAENQKPWWEMRAEEVYLSRVEIFALCSECENGIVCEDEEGAYVQRKNLDMCFDCPVKGAEEAMDENAAER